jgi:NTP pyrophosphatase (non-canonical NTP hydrolase)
MSDETTTIRALRDLLRDFVSQREWQKYHDPKNLSMSIAIEAAELMEHFQWVRNADLEALRSDAATMSEIREEVADVLAYVVALANALDLDLSAALADKMRKNAEKYPAEEFRGHYQKPR